MEEIEKQTFEDEDEDSDDSEDDQDSTQDTIQDEVPPTLGINVGDGTKVASVFGQTKESMKSENNQQ